ncbi:MAG: GNAT family N-acetyltransferase [Blautia sp.]
MDFVYTDNKISLMDERGRVLAEVTFPEAGESVVNINHTFVDDSLRGQGIAGRMMEAAAEHLRKQNKKVVLTCSYAVKWFEKHPEYSDLLQSDQQF